jgi:hypothetical protein
VYPWLVDLQLLPWDEGSTQEPVGASEVRAALDAKRVRRLGVARWPCDHQRTTGLAAQGGQAADDGSGTVSGHDGPPGAGLAQVVMGDDRSEDGERAPGDQVEQGELRGEDPQPCPGAELVPPLGQVSKQRAHGDGGRGWEVEQAEGDGADRVRGGVDAGKDPDRRSAGEEGDRHRGHGGTEVGGHVPDEEETHVALPKHPEAAAEPGVSLLRQAPHPATVDRRRRAVQLLDNSELTVPDPPPSTLVVMAPSGQCGGRLGRRMGGWADDGGMRIVGGAGGAGTGR